MEKIESVLKRIFTEGPLKGSSAEIALFSAWPEVVGPKITARARPASLSRGVLRVAVSDSGWLMTLNFMKGEILKKLTRAAPEAALSEISLFVGPLPDLLESEELHPFGPEEE